MRDATHFYNNFHIINHFFVLKILMMAIRFQNGERQLKFHSAFHRSELSKAERAKQSIHLEHIYIIDQSIYVRQCSIVW